MIASNRRPRRRTIITRRRASIAMILAGLTLLGISGQGVAAHMINEGRQAALWQQHHAYAMPVAGLFHFTHPALSPGQPLAKMEVAKLNYSAIVIEGVDNDSLAAGPGHYSGTAWPGESDTMIIEGHNGFWLGFPALSDGDQVVFSDSDGRFTYVVDGHRVVDPAQSHIAPSGRPSLNLVTCWPIWAGAFAPQRLIISAHLQA